METPCITDTYSMHKRKKEFNERRKYVSNLDCCNHESCDKLANEYEKLKYDCHDIYKPQYVGDLDEKGNISDERDVICHIFKEKQDHYSNLASEFKKRTSRTRSRIKSRNGRTGGKKNKGKTQRKKNHRKK